MPLLGARGLTNGNNIYFSIDSGKTNLKNFNFPNGGGSDPQDWASGASDCFNAFSSSGVLNGLSAVDIRTLDVIGYNLVSSGARRSPPARRLAAPSASVVFNISSMVLPADNP